VPRLCGFIARGPARRFTRARDAERDVTSLPLISRTNFSCEFPSRVFSSKGERTLSRFGLFLN